MCRDSCSISLARDSCSDSEKAMATEDVLRLSYSHCPLKKRPVLICQDIHEPQDAGVGQYGAPENLSMKPEDLRINCEPLVLPPAAVTATSSKIRIVEDHLKSKASATLLRRYLQSFPLSPQSIENKAFQDGLDPIHAGTSLTCPLTPSRSPAFNYSPHFHRRLSSTEASGDFKHFRRYPEQSFKECHAYSIHSYRKESLHIQNSSLTQSPVIQCKPLSSFSTYRSVSMRTPSPPLTPEDLSSPGSVASSGCCSTGSTGYRNTNNGSSKQRYQCSFCLKCYSTYSGVTKHQRSHCIDNTDLLAKKCFGCKYCDKVYVSSGALKMHIRTHTLPCKCFICGKAFSRPWLLQGHIRTHTGEKPFSCPICERAFADRSNLRAHLQTHSEVKRYSCSHCGKTFSRMSLLTKHRVGGCPGPELPSEEGLTFKH